MIKTVIYTDADLDGVSSVLALWWSKGFNLYEADIRATTLLSLKESNIEILPDIEYYFCDLNVSDIPNIDKPNVTIFDHHEDHSTESYKSAKAIIDLKALSTASVIKNYYNKITSLKKLALIKLVDTYDSYVQGDIFPIAKDLNIIFRSYSGYTRMDSFIKDFRHGFSGSFTQQQQEVISQYKQMFDVYYSKLKPNEYIHNGIKFIAVIASAFHNDICEKLLDEYKGDVCMIVNTELGRVSLRRSLNCSVSLHTLASKLIDGGGHTAAAGGVITPIFITFMKNFNPINVS
jgi:oligoribonuclease NrnB/cAMP/cGMP phosphodiesterase (DHH superfamily)